MVQVPEVTMVAVVPETVQTDEVIEAKLTVKPEVDEADSVSGVPTVCVPGLLKVMVCAAAFTVKLCSTGVAAAYVELPACVAWMVQVPEVSMVPVVPETEQTTGVVEAKLTVSPEVEEAESVSGVPTVWTPGLLNVMVCACPFTVKLCDTGVAAAYVELPACVAWMVQVPEVSIVPVVPETVQTDEVIEAKLTVRPEVDEAESVSGVPTVCVPGLLKVMVCVWPFTVKLCETGVAAA
jgi:hypothetical protein